MKKIVFSIVFFSSLCLVSFAQQNHNGNQGQHNGQQGGKAAHGGGQGQKQTSAQKAARLTQYMTSSLNLSAEQQSKVAALNTSKAQQVDSIRSKYKGNMEAAKPELKTARDTYNASLNTILTADQKKKWDEIKKQKKEEFQKNRAAGTKPAEGEITPEDLD
ncbi:hypothetical protein [Cytophaga hutchinsonii]|uniref:LTXXQ motif family protein n=1 Tax=Cytophaga hutchinsonii (strain ATCC 33406 / DSM 1761 / CIP 103989 / NBRC 15051 / NCIMB 9469 / D465) TaxID=269798 RepID=A0A6N4SRX3_CYTH3|nr:hypothetical protein [Cytophaga hutchinsonii]ABG59100.1 conserved hypothetical protein [Cytophaga hutchinsonii ATCC 33406]SFX36857.1 hypothetical protein SAMN04487930_103208 [Cytophaga hutchinsonii ATCC 33406]